MLGEFCYLNFSKKSTAKRRLPKGIGAWVSNNPVSILSPGRKKQRPTVKGVSIRT